MGIGSSHWLALIIGNSRWHWGAFEGDRWLGTWHTPHLSEAQVQQLVQGRFAIPAGIASRIAPWQQLDLDPALPSDLSDWLPASTADPELWVASVVASPLAWLAGYPALHRVETAQVPLQNLYPTLGVDRALALLGAGETWGWPVLVIDCGTALTFTAGENQRLIGGAILPGLRLQVRALYTHTDQLPEVTLNPGQWPQRWATDTATAIASGIWHTQLAGIRDFIAAWHADWPTGAVVLTGGDSAAVVEAIDQQSPSLAAQIQVDPDLAFWGLRSCRQRMVL